MVLLLGNPGFGFHLEIKMGRVLWISNERDV